LALADYPIALRVDGVEIDALGRAATHTESEVRMKRDGDIRFRHQGVCLLCAAPGADIRHIPQGICGDRRRIKSSGSGDPLFSSIQKLVHHALTEIVKH
jgi:hypothetical protein